MSNWGEQSVSLVDPLGGQVRQTIPVGTHPSALALSAARHELYVANTDSDSVSVVDTQSNQVTQTIDLARTRMPSKAAARTPWRSRATRCMWPTPATTTSPWSSSARPLRSWA